MLISGFILAAIAVVLLKAYLDQQQKAMREETKKALVKWQQNQTAVFVAKADIPKGALIEGAMLEPAVVPNQYLQPQVVTSIERITGMQTIAPIAKGEQITLSKMQQSGKMGGNLANVTPVGKRAVTISVDNIASLAGMVRPGDYVDVVGILPIPVQTPEGKKDTQFTVLPLFQNVLILAVGQDIGSGLVQQDSRYKETKREISPLVTLALSPTEANIVAFVREQGKFSLTLRSPADAQTELSPPTSWDELFQYIMPQMMQAKKKEDADSPEIEGYVDIYRGLNKDRVPIYKETKE